MNDEQPAVDVQQRLDRPARKQVPGPVTHEHKHSHGPVNIWSGRQLGGRGERGSRPESRQQPSSYRCKPVLDSGKTKGSQGDVNTFCLFFAKGLCYQGPDCPYLHRLPTATDNSAMARNTGSDIFGREKMPAGLENKKGAGSYELDMTTLYVNYGGAGHYAVPQLRHLLLQNFGEWGPVRHIHIVPTKTIAFVKYHWRVSAEFAREAMDQQQLTGSTLHEVLAVRWAYDDPNPTAVLGRKRQALDAVETAAMSAWEALPAEEKRARIAMAQQARAQRVSAVAATLPELPPDDSFDVWRGFGGRHQQQQQQRGTAAAAAAEAGGEAVVQSHGNGQQQQQQHWAGQSGTEGSEQAAEGAWHAEHAQYPGGQLAAGEQLQSQQVPGSAPGGWFQGWRQRHKPETFADTLGIPAAAGGGEKPAQAGPAAAAGGASDGGGLGGLLAGYGSDSEAEAGGG